MLTKEEIRDVVRQVLVEEKKNNGDDMDEVLLKTVSAILTSFGIRDDERKEFSEDFRYLRRWRLGAERIQGIGLTTIIALMVGGLVSALGLGLKAMIGK